MKKYKIGIIGCGHIAEKMAATINGMQEAESYAVASRSIEKAQAFATKWNFSKAYGSYEELVTDSEVDLVYIATPHSHHFEHARLCIMNGKPVLCEKSFTANARQAEELIRLAEEKNVFITEAIWTRYMPLSVKMKELLDTYRTASPKRLEDILEFYVRFEAIKPFQSGNGRVGRLLMLSECLRNGIVPFILFKDMKPSYHHGLSIWHQERSVLRDICREAQHHFQSIMEHFSIV